MAHFKFWGGAESPQKNQESPHWYIYIATMNSHYELLKLFSCQAPTGGFGTKSPHWLMIIFLAKAWGKTSLFSWTDSHMSRYRAAQTPTWAGSHAHDIIHYIQLSISIVVDLWLIIFEYVLIDGYIMWHTYYIRVMPNMGLVFWPYFKTNPHPTDGSIVTYGSMVQSHVTWPSNSDTAGYTTMVIGLTLW